MLMIITHMVTSLFGVGASSYNVLISPAACKQTDVDLEYYVGLPNLAPGFSRMGDFGNSTCIGLTHRLL